MHSHADDFFDVDDKTHNGWKECENEDAKENDNGYDVVDLMVTVMVTMHGGDVMMTVMVMVTVIT